jgi:hypothetical protein
MEFFKTFQIKIISKMKLTDQVAPLAQSIKLKELGITQCADFTWSYNVISNQYEVSMHPMDYMIEIIDRVKRSGVAHDYELASAFTVAELGKMIILLAELEEWEPSATHKLKYKEEICHLFLYNPEFLADSIIDAIESNCIPVDKINHVLSPKNIIS